MPCLLCKFGVQGTVFGTMCVILALLMGRSTSTSVCSPILPIAALLQCNPSLYSYHSFYSALPLFYYGAVPQRDCAYQASRHGPPTLVYACLVSILLRRLSPMPVIVRSLREAHLVNSFPKSLGIKLARHDTDVLLHSDLTESRAQGRCGAKFLHSLVMSEQTALLVSASGKDS